MTGERSVCVLAPAKINLFLRIVGRRADGYHLLDSLMLPIDLYDEIAITVEARSAAGVTIACDAPEVPSGPENLAYRAAALVLKRAGISAHVAIRLRKQIPSGSGLGGGSSDAAAVLTGLNQALNMRRSVAELARWAAELGADVPFFVHGRPARVQGIGEVVTPLAGWGGLPLVIARPGLGLSTASIYRRFDEALADGRASLTKESFATSIADFAGHGLPVRELLVNDLEAVAAEAYPEWVSLKMLLLELGAQGALMTGSGSAVFGIWPSRQAAEAAAEMVRDWGYWAVAAQTLERSPATA